MPRIITTILVSIHLLLASLSYAEDSIKIATWNIQNFGITKCNDASRMRKIASILKDYDLIAVQEISNVREQSDPGCPKNQNACPGDKNCGAIRNALHRYLNAVYGRNYEFVFSEQVKDERYLFIYNPAKVSLAKAELAPDPGDTTVGTRKAMRSRGLSETA